MATTLREPKPRTTQASPLEQEATAAPTQSWWKNLKLVIPLTVIVVGLIAVAAVAVGIMRGNGDNVSVSPSAAAAAPAAAPVTAPVAPVAPVAEPAPVAPVAAAPARAVPGVSTFIPAIYKLNDTNCQGDPGRTVACFYAFLLQGKTLEAESLIVFPAGPKGYTLAAYTRDHWGVTIEELHGPAGQAQLLNIAGIKTLSLEYYPLDVFTKKPTADSTAVENVKPGTPLSDGFYAMELEFLTRDGTNTTSTITLYLSGAGVPSQVGRWYVTVF